MIMLKGYQYKLKIDIYIIECRAVGMANNKNRIMIVVPCHRIIGSNKKLVGYAGGLKLKEQLLNLEKNFN